MDYQKRSFCGSRVACSVCRRLLFRNQVVGCNHQTYTSKGQSCHLMASKCITGTYVHHCNDDCDIPCLRHSSSWGSEWICHACHRHLLKATMPSEAAANNLQLTSIPEPLKKLNALESQLLALNIPFMKVLPLPKGGQKGMKGSVSLLM